MAKRSKQRRPARNARSRFARGARERGGSRRAARRDDGLIEGMLRESGGRPGWRLRDETGALWHLDTAAGAKAGDRVVALPIDGSRRAELLHVVEGARDHWIGLLHRRGGMIWATPYRDEGEWSLRVAATDAGEGEDGDVVELVPAARRGGRRARPGEPPFARVTRRIGRPGEPDADFAAVVWRHRLPVQFPEPVLAELSALDDSPELEAPPRVDLCELPFVTIDPDDARDFDDAVHAEWGASGLTRLWVAVADVSHYVRRGSALDREALRRGNSVYFPDRAIPMLPHRLSSDLCSLRPDCERLALVAELELDGCGATRRARFHPARIRSRARLTYREAQARIDSASGSHADLLAALAGWAAERARERRARGGLDFELPGVEIDFDAARLPCHVRPALRTAAHRLVEEAMLAANQAVAEWLCGDAVPVPYRNHEPPTGEAVALLADHLRGLGIARGLPRGPLSSRALARALAGTPVEQVPVVHNLVLRQLRQARYGAVSVGHFGLALSHYLHFTSPIRRYADLVVHRAVKERLAGGAPCLSRVEGQRVAAQASVRERVAQRAEREMLDLARCAFLRAHVGEEHDGRISGLGRPGLFVTLEAWPIDGLVRASRLGGAEPDALGHTLATGQGRRFGLGDRVRVRIAAVDVVRARVELELTDPPEDRRRTRAQSRRGVGARSGSRRGAGRSRSRAPATQ